jgi:hypothetical protein
MTQTATLLWLLAREPTAGERRLVADLAHQKHVTLVAPTPTRNGQLSGYRSDLVLDIEGRLDEARTLASSLDEEHALVLLAAVAADLQAHPELPQAAWLLAEHHHIEAEVRRSDPTSAEQVEALERAELVLAGPRAPAFGTPDGEVVTPPAPLAINVRDLSVQDRLEIDGQSGGAERSVRPGLHQVRVLRDGDVIFAEWQVLGEQSDVTLGVRPLLPCSDEELAAASLHGSSVVLRYPVACERWFVARPASVGFEIADCHASACGNFVPIVETRPSAKPFPTWATAALIGVGAAAAATFATWAAGGFEREPAPPGKTVFVYGGLH